MMALAGTADRRGIEVLCGPPQIQTGTDNVLIVALADYASPYTIAAATPAPVVYAPTATRTPSASISMPLIHHRLAVTRARRAPTLNCATNASADDHRMRYSTSGTIRARDDMRLPLAPCLQHHQLQSAGRVGPQAQEHPERLVLSILKHVLMTHIHFGLVSSIGELCAHSSINLSSSPRLMRATPHAVLMCFRISTPL